VHGIVTDSVDAGATLVTGGRRPEHLDRGWFYEPTVLDAPSNADPSAQREIFGPVVTVLGYRTIDEAISIANDHELGLSAGVYTDDLAQGLAIAERIRSGTVQVNTGMASGYTPMGGYKHSGYGRERGSAGIRAFQELKHVVIGSR
jgi:acyl-CoA reductase-like NAD-dependent aldehyde dehydrogenase